MLLSALIDRLNIDAGRPPLPALPDIVTGRSLERAIVQVNVDMHKNNESFQRFTVAWDASGDIPISVLTPEPNEMFREAFLILALQHLIDTGLIALTDLPSWRDGDKSVDRARQMITKDALVVRLWDRYQRILGLDEIVFAHGSVANAVDWREGLLW